jgi:hypothetical protein
MSRRPRELTPLAGRARRVLVAVAIAAGALSSVSAQPQEAQDAPATRGVVKLGKVPVSSETVTIKLPKAAGADLSNGVHLMVLEDHRAPQVQFSLVIPGAGGYYDPDDESGLAGITAALMREGTASRSSR